MQKERLMIGIRRFESGVKGVLGMSALISVLTTIGIVTILSKESITFFNLVNPFDFLFGTSWEPLLEPKSFGVLPLVSGTLLIVLGAGLLAIPVGTMTALYLSEYASDRVRSSIKPILEILAGIPTIVYGYFALTFVTPVLKTFFPETEVFNALSGAIVVGIMILPMISTLCDDTFQAVPQELKAGGYALGTSSYEVISEIVVPSSLARIFSSYLLALSRAIGETMAVTLASGANPQFTFDPLKSIQTMTAYIVQVSLGDTPQGGVEYMTCFAVGGLLFVMTLFLNLLGEWIIARSKRKNQ